MIVYKSEIGEEEQEALTEISLDRPKVVQKRRRVLAVCFILEAAYLAAAIFSFVRGSVYYGGLLLFFCLVFVFIAAFCGSMQRASIRKALGKNVDKIKDSESEYIIDDGGVQISSRFGQSRNNWDAFEDYGTKGYYTYIVAIDGRQCILIDRRKLTEEELAELDRLTGSIKK